MTHKHIVDEVADFVVGATTANISARTMRTLKRNVLDSIACAAGALDGELIEPVRAHAEQFSGRPTATFIGGGRASVDIRRRSSTPCWCAIPTCSTSS